MGCSLFLSSSTFCSLFSFLSLLWSLLLPVFLPFLSVHCLSPFFRPSFKFFNYFLSPFLPFPPSRPSISSLPPSLHGALVQPRQACPSASAGKAGKLTGLVLVRHPYAPPTHTSNAAPSCIPSIPSPTSPSLWSEGHRVASDYMTLHVLRAQNHVYSR